MPSGHKKDKEGNRRGVSRRHFLATGSAALTLIPAQGALAKAATSLNSAPSPSGGAEKVLVGASGRTAAHGAAQVTELASSTKTLSTASTLESQDSPMGRMFPTLPAYLPTDQSLVDLAGTMPVSRPADNPDNGFISAGFTYLGQFIDHDVTFDEVSNLLGTNDPNALSSSRTARYDLDSVYGGGPDFNPEFYDTADPKKFLITSSKRGVEDVPRDDAGKAIIADARNDMHKIIVQLHLAFMKFHNKVVDLLRGQGVPEETLFAAAQQTVRWNYQWIVANEFLSKIARADVVNEILTVDATGIPRVVTRFFQPVAGNAFMPVEFSAAAFRFAHSIVRAAYKVNATTTGTGLPLFGRLLGGNPVNETTRIEWGNFFPIPGSSFTAQPSQAIDGKLSAQLGDVPNAITGDGLVKSLAERNLRRGKSFGLPSGQQVAAHIGAEIITNEQLGLTDPGLAGETPLWFYILKEAEIQEAGRRLGQVGSLITAEVLLGMLAADPTTYLHAVPPFQPSPPIGRASGNLGMADLLLFAGVPI